MVLTVTINPLLEKRFFFKSLSENNRAYKQIITAGGKGINVSRQLNILGINNLALTFLGGANGKKLRSILEQEKINFSVVNIKDETREASLIFDDQNEKLNTYFGINPQILDSEINFFIDKLEKAIINSSIVAFTGSIPNESASIIFEKGIELCHKYDKISILDSYGNSLSKMIEKSPLVIHNNFDEIKKSLNQELKNENDIRKLLNYFYSHRSNLSFLTRGSKSTYAAKSDFHYKIINPKIIEKDSTGSGDAFLAGVIYGLEKSLSFNEFVTLSAALGAANASTWNVCNIAYADAEKLFNNVKIIEIGKKIKIIDDSPTI